MVDISENELASLRQLAGLDPVPPPLRREQRRAGIELAKPPGENQPVSPAIDFPLMATEMAPVARIASLGQPADVHAAGRAYAREAGYTDEGILELEGFMARHGATDYRVAMVAFEALQPKPEPVTSSAGPYTGLYTPAPSAEDDGQAFLSSLLAGDGDRLLDQSIAASIRAVRNSR